MALRLVSILWLLSLISFVSARCKNFQPRYFHNNTIDYAFTSGQDTFVASAIVNCSTAPGQTTPGVFTGNEIQRCASNQCYLATPNNWWIRINRTLSISVDAATEQSIFDVVEPQYGAARRLTDFNATKIWPLTRVATCINESSTGYWGFSPIYSCIEGSLTDCEQGTSPAEGTFIRACGVRILPAVNQASGEFAVVRTFGISSRPPPPNATENASTGGAGLHMPAGLKTLLLAFVLTIAFHQGI